MDTDNCVEEISRHERVIGKSLLNFLIISFQQRPRKRRVRDELGHWIDEKDLEGRTIEVSQILHINHDFVY